MSPEDLLKHASTMGIKRMALTDINNTSGCLDFLRLAPQYKITPIVGVDFRRHNKQLYICLAKNNKGFKEINEHLSHYNTNHIEIPDGIPYLPNCFIVHPWHKGKNIALGANEYIGIHPEDVDAFRLFVKQYLIDKQVVLATATFRNKKDFNTHRLLRAIYTNELLSRLPKEQEGRQADILLPLQKLIDAFAEQPKAHLKADELLRQCHVDLGFGQKKNKNCFSGSAKEDEELLLSLAEEGLAYRYGETPNDVIISRFNSELKTIRELGFVAYFLINWDMVRFAREQGFFYIGRGSGANSIIAYCLRITDVDPIELDLYFERFINPSRKNPPDFDIDFSYTDRDTIRDYLFEKYKGHIALVGSYSTFERNSAIRNIAKVFGLPDAEIDNLQSERLDMKSLDEYGKLVLKYAASIYGMPNQLSSHACGILISEEPITCYTALELMPVGYVSTQFSMLEAEDVGLHKFDILSQRGLGHIKDAVLMAQKNTGQEIDIHRIQDFKEDVPIKDLIKRGDTIGCFYVESPAMRQLMRKLEVDDYLGLVAASSVIRPGVASSGMMREYILRYRYPEKRKEAHPKLLEIMEETFGVMVYQEDVIKVAHYYAGLTLEEADVMRRGMSGKFRSRAEFQQVKQKFFDNCKERNYLDAEATEIWRQIESFAGYSFAKGHSASFAVESYQSIFLRAYYPIEFITGVLNNFGGFYSTEFYLHEAKMLGAIIELPCVNMSDVLMRLENKTIYMGFCLVKDLEQKAIAAIIQERNDNGLYASLQEFIKRVAISLEQLRILIRIKAFRFTGKTSKELLWEAHLLLSRTKKTVPRKELFAVEAEPSDLPKLEYGAFEDG